MEKYKDDIISIIVCICGAAIAAFGGYIINDEEIFAYSYVFAFIQLLISIRLFRRVINGN